MLPGIDLRLGNMIKAVQEVVLPAIPADETLAREQARLLIGHLGIIKEQWRHAVRFEARSFDAMRELTRALQPHVDADQSAKLQAALSEVEQTDRQDIDSLNAGVCLLGAAVDAVILGGDGRKPLSRAAWEIVLAYGDADARRQRTWFQGVGIDPDRAELPPMVEAL